jgi:hypothetical protein
MFLSCVLPNLALNPPPNCHHIINSMLCDACSLHFVYSNQVLRKIIEHKLTYKPGLDSQSNQALQRDARRYKRAVKMSIEGEAICPWYLGDWSAIPAVPLCDGHDIKIWDGRLGTEILEAAESCCQLCSRLCTIVSSTPKFRRTSQGDSLFTPLPPSVPDPSNILAVELESWLVLHPWTSLPVGLRFLVVSSCGSVDSAWVEFHIAVHGNDEGGGVHCLLR